MIIPHRLGFVFSAAGHIFLGLYFNVLLAIDLRQLVYADVCFWNMLLHLPVMLRAVQYKENQHL